MWNVARISALGLGIRILEFRARGQRFRLQGCREGLVEIQVKFDGTGLVCYALGFRSNLILTSRSESPAGDWRPRFWLWVVLTCFLRYF